MIDAQELTGLGLTSYEAAASLALLERAELTSADVAARAAIPRQRVYDVLGSLTAKGLCLARDGAPGVLSRSIAAILRHGLTRRVLCWLPCSRGMSRRASTRSPAKRSGRVLVPTLSSVQTVNFARSPKCTRVMTLPSSSSLTSAPSICTRSL